MAFCQKDDAKKDARHRHLLGIVAMELHAMLYKMYDRTIERDGLDRYDIYEVEEKFNEYIRIVQLVQMDRAESQLL